MLRLAFLLMLLPFAGQAACRDMVFETASYTVCEADRSEDLRLFYQDANGPLGSFAAVNELLKPQGKKLAFAMNAGMYHPDLSPVGLFKAEGVQVTPLVKRAGPGNFGMTPNGVFCIGKRFAVVETNRYDAKACRDATQSGPMLVIDGALHPRFLPDSDSLHIRNGVGVSLDGAKAYFAISNVPVNFYNFARLFRDGLGVNNALYLDGSISRLYAPGLRRDDFGFQMGPIVGLVVPRD